MPVVYIKFPKTGLGNMLLVWARGALFAKLNGIQYHSTSWWGFHWGALIRRERKNRLYANYFIEGKLQNQLSVQWNIFFKVSIKNPEIEKIHLNNNDNKVYLFNTVLTGNDLFKNLRDHSSIVKEELEKILHPSVIKQLEISPSPFIGIHIRRGDFKLGKQTTPLSFFINGIELIRSVLGWNAPVTVFTDADKDELSGLTTLPEIYFSEDKKDITDILLLSRSRILILSKSSTFSYWAAFLSEALVIRPHDDWQDKIKDFKPGFSYKEIKWNDTNDNSSAEMIQALKCRERVYEYKK